MAYLFCHLHKLAEVVAPFWQLTEIATSFYRQTQQEQVFKEIKTFVTSATALKFYDKVTIQCDASEKELGATLMLNGHLIVFASQALSSVEQAYVQIERVYVNLV